LGIDFLRDAFHLPKVWAQSIQWFGRSVDWKLELTSWVVRAVFYVKGGQSMWWWRTVRAPLPVHHLFFVFDTSVFMSFA
jgi:hypothetical protein